MNEIKKLRRRTKLTQKAFAAKYEIPLKTLQNWESPDDKNESRLCPAYVVKLLKTVVEIDYPEDTFAHIDRMAEAGKLQNSKRHIKSLKQGLKKIENSDIGDYVQDVILYGSFARGRARKDSDVDLSIVLSERIKGVPKYSRIISRLKGNISPSDYNLPEVDLHVTYGRTWRTSREAYYQNIREEGIRVWN